MISDNVTFKLDFNDSGIVLNDILMDPDYAVMQLDYFRNDYLSKIECKYVPLGYYKENGWNESILSKIIIFHTCDDITDYRSYKTHNEFDNELMDAINHGKSISITVSPFSLYAFNNDNHDIICIKGNYDPSILANQCVFLGFRQVINDIYDNPVLKSISNIIRPFIMNEIEKRGCKIDV